MKKILYGSEAKYEKLGLVTLIDFENFEKIEDDLAWRIRALVISCLTLLTENEKFKDSAYKLMAHRYFLENDVRIVI